MWRFEFRNVKQIWLPALVIAYAERVGVPRLPMLVSWLAATDFGCNLGSLFRPELFLVINEADSVSCARYMVQNFNDLDYAVLDCSVEIVSSADFTTDFAAPELVPNGC